MTARRLTLLLTLFALAFVGVFGASCSCGDDDDDDDTGDLPNVDDDDTGDDDDTAGDDDLDDDTDDDDADDDDIDDDVDDDDADDDDIPPTTEGFVYAPAGAFLAGSPSIEPGHDADEAQRTVTISRAFEIGETEVTKEQFRTLSGFDPANFPVYGDSPLRPVEQVSWFDALVYANQLSAQEGYDPCFAFDDVVCDNEDEVDGVADCATKGGVWSATVTLNAATLQECEGFRLPTEAEWEYAARAGSTTALPNGEITSHTCETVDPNVDAIAWYCFNGKNTTHPVAKKQANDWGLYDVIGNVLEWTWDWYESDVSGDATDPTGAAGGHFRVAKGGGYRWYAPVRQRPAWRGGHQPGYNWRLLGFRLVRTLPGEAIATPADAPRPVEAGAPAPKALPTSLPFSFTRPAAGTPLTQQEIDDFTTKITGFWKDSFFWERLTWIGHGYDDTAAGNGYPEYKLYWQDTTVTKSGDTVTFAHVGGADNLMIRLGKLLGAAVGGYLASGDPMFARLVEDYSKGIDALFLSMDYDDEDPEKDLMPRTPFTVNHEYTEDGRHAVVDYDPVKQQEKYDWNAHTIPNDTNPHWGPIWLRNMRSKDDVPHIMRVAVPLMYAAQDAPDADVKAAAAQALKKLRDFSRDIVDSEYHIRTKDKYGNAYVPIAENGIVADLASFVLYEPFVPNGECTAKISSAFIGYGDALENDCGNGIGWLYDLIATIQHYYNWAIIRYFHISAVENALVAGENDMAHDLIEGLATRANDIMNDADGRAANLEWDADYAGFLAASAAAGLPLTADETRLLVDEYSYSADFYGAWPYHDLWDESVGDGVYPFEPTRNDGEDRAVRFPEMAFILQYCASPFINTAGQPFVNCDIVLDPSQWGS
ncbi:formylglycine-generating enzyme family protein [bacterium]|nr:formylglycine-generating enzyme family protein [bacterium]